MEALTLLILFPLAVWFFWTSITNLRSAVDRGTNSLDKLAHLGEKELDGRLQAYESKQKSRLESLLES